MLGSVKDATSVSRLHGGIKQQTEDLLKGKYENQDQPFVWAHRFTQPTLKVVKESILEEGTVCPEGAKEISQAEQRRGFSRHKEQCMQRYGNHRESGMFWEVEINQH